MNQLPIVNVFLVTLNKTKLKIHQGGKCSFKIETAIGGSWSLQCVHGRACPCTLLHQGDGCCHSHWLTTHPGSCCPHCGLCLDPLATNFWCLTSLCSVFVDLLPQHLFPTAFCFPLVVSSVGNKPYFCHPWLASYSYKYLLCSSAFKPVWRQGSGQLWRYFGIIPFLMRIADKGSQNKRQNGIFVSRPCYFAFCHVLHFTPQPERKIFPMAASPHPVHSLLVLFSAGMKTLLSSA